MSHNDKVCNTHFMFSFDTRHLVWGFFHSAFVFDFVSSQVKDDDVAVKEKH